jgi:hypothetical protein
LHSVTTKYATGWTPPPRLQYGTQTGEHPACSTVPQPTTLSRAPPPWLQYGTQTGEHPTCSTVPQPTTIRSAPPSYSMGLKPASFPLVAQCLNQLRYDVPPGYSSDSNAWVSRPTQITVRDSNGCVSRPTQVTVRNSNTWVSRPTQVTVRDLNAWVSRPTHVTVRDSNA